jgi:hypothetical protein
MSTAAEEYKTHSKEFFTGELPRAAFSTDATNDVMWRCQHNLRQANMGFQQTHPARSYNLTTNYRRQILHTMKGHPCRWNDKTLAYFDKFPHSIHHGKILQDVKFELLSWEGITGASQLQARDYGGHSFSFSWCPEAESVILNNTIQQFQELSILWHSESSPKVVLKFFIFDWRTLNVVHKPHYFSGVDRPHDSIWIHIIVLRVLRFLVSSFSLNVLLQCLHHCT